MMSFCKCSGGGNRLSTVDSSHKNGKCPKKYYDIPTKKDIAVIVSRIEQDRVLVKSITGTDNSLTKVMEKAGFGNLRSDNYMHMLGHLSEHGYTISNVSTAGSNMITHLYKEADISHYKYVEILKN